MAENRNITWNITLKINQNVSTPFKLTLKEQHLDWGKWASNPPSEIKVPANASEVKVTCKAQGAQCSATGTEGYFVYKSTDSLDHPTEFTFKFDIPYSSANSGNVTGSSSNYDLDNGGGVPKSGNSPTVNVVITQVEPTI